MITSPQTFPKVMVKRVYTICMMMFNLPRMAMHPTSRDTAGVTIFMSEQPAKHGTDLYGWGEDRAVGAVNLANPATESLMKDFDVSGQQYSTEQLLIDEMRARHQFFSDYSKSPGAEFEAFKAEFCDDQGNLIDLTTVDKREIYLLVEGHHRALRSFFDAHVTCLKSDPPKKYSLDIPVIPTVFHSKTELLLFQTRGNASDGKQNRLTTIDICKIAREVFRKVGGVNEFKKLMGEASPRRASGQDSDEKPKEDAGSTAVFAWAVAELDQTYPHLEVWRCLTTDAKDTEHVKLSDLGIQPRPDWMKCITTILQLADKEKMDSYWVRFSDRAVDEVRKVHDSGEYWGHKELAEWWEGRKRNKHNGQVATAVAPPQVLKMSVVEQWKKTAPNIYARLSATALLDVNSDAFRELENQSNADFANAFHDLSKTPYRDLLKEFALVVSAANVEGKDLKVQLQDCIGMIKATFTKPEPDKTAPVKSESVAKTPEPQAKEKPVKAK